MFKWQCLWIFSVVLCISSSVWSQSHKYALTDDLDALFKNTFDYDENINDIKQAREQEFYPDYDQEDKRINDEIENKNNIDVFKDSLQVEDIRFDISKDRNVNDEKYENKEEIVNDKNMNGSAPINNYDPNKYNDYVEDVIMKSPYEKPINLADQLFEKNYAIDNIFSEEMDKIILKSEKTNSDSDSETFQEAGIDSNFVFAPREILEQSETLLNNNNSQDKKEPMASDQSDNDKNKNELPQSQLQNILDESVNNFNVNDNFTANNVDVIEQDEINSISQDESYGIQKELETLKDILNIDNGTNDENIDDIINDFFDTYESKSDNNNIKNTQKETKDILSESQFDGSETNISDDSRQIIEEVGISQRIIEKTNASLNEDTSDANNTREKYDITNEIENSVFDESSDLNQQLIELGEIIKKLQNNDYNNNDDDDHEILKNEDSDGNQDNLELKSNNNNVEIPYGNDAIQTHNIKSDELNNYNKSNIEHIDENSNTPDESGVDDVFNVQKSEEILNKLDEPIRQNIDVRYYSEKELTDLNSQELYDLMYERGTKIEDNLDELNINPVHYKLSLEEAVVISSPNYPEPYNGNIVIDWFFDGEDANGIELNITDFSVDDNSGDYLLVKPGKTDIYGEGGLIFTYMLRHERKYRFLDVDRMFVRFESKGDNLQNFKGFQFSVKFVEPKINRDIAPEPLPEPSAQVAAETLTLHLTGFMLYGVEDLLEEFRNILIAMASAYIEENEIDLGELPLDEVVQLTRIVSCSISWPGSETCAAVTFGVPLYYNDDTDYRLTEEQLVEMWTTYAAIDPFSSKLRAIGIDMYDVPNERRILSAWWSASFASLIIVLGVGYAIWRCNCFDECNGMTRLREDDSIHSDRKSDLSLYPTPHQDLPPLFPDSQQYEKYLNGDFTPDGDTTRVDIGGAFTNKSFVRDGELMDLDSDEEIIMSLPDDGKDAAKRQSYTPGIRPRDVYDA